MLNPASGRDAGREAVPAAAAGRRGQRLPGRPGRGGGARRRPVGRRAARRRPRPGRRLGARHGPRRRRGPPRTWVPTLAPSRDDLRGVRAARARGWRSPCRRTWRTGERLGPVQFDYQPDLDTDLGLFPNKDAVLLPRAGARTRRARLLRHAAPADVGPRLVPARRERPPARPGSPTRARGSGSPTSRSTRCTPDVRALTRPARHRLVALPEYPYEELKIGAGPPPMRVAGGLAAHPPRRDRRDRATGSTNRQRPRSTRPGRCCSTPTTRRACSPAPPTPLLDARDRRRAGRAPCRTSSSPPPIEEVDGRALRVLRHGRRQDRRRPAGPVSAPLDRAALGRRDRRLRVGSRGSSPIRGGSARPVRAWRSPTRVVARTPPSRASTAPGPPPPGRT